MCELPKNSNGAKNVLFAASRDDVENMKPHL